MLCIIDYGAGNVQSVLYALGRLGHRAEVTADPERVRAADRVIFPGVGAARASMEALRERGLAEALPALTQPVLGICVGLQVLGTHSEEEDTPTLGIVDAPVRRFRPADPRRDRVPHMGWNTLRVQPGSWVPAHLDGARVYYVHSYAMDPGPHAVATTHYADFTFTAALRQGNFYGTQFHTEKSGGVGEEILRAFLEHTG